MADFNLNYLNILTYNMHGFNQGSVALDEFCLNKKFYDVVFVQEHWLNTCNLSYFHKYANYSYYGKSAIEDRSNVLQGRPYGGVMTLVNKSLCNAVNVLLIKDRVVILLIDHLVFVNVYMPCDDGTIESKDLAIEILSDITDVLSSSQYQGIIFGGDLNCDLSTDSHISPAVNDFLSDFNLKYFDMKRHNRDAFTFSNASRNAFSLIDYLCVSEELYNCMHSYHTVTCVNLSDHEPVLLCLRFPPHCTVFKRHATVLEDVHINNNAQVGGVSSSDYIKNYRFDKMDRISYYDYTRLHLEPVLREINCLLTLNNYSQNLHQFRIENVIENIYNNIVNVLKNGTNLYVPQIKLSSLKHWWDEDLKFQKNKSMQVFKIWSEAGKPRSGPLFNNMNKEKQSYKKMIRERKNANKNTLSSSLEQDLSDKNLTSFWKTWNNKVLNKSSACPNIKDCIDAATAAVQFKEYFQSIACPSDDQFVKSSKRRLVEKLKEYSCCNNPLNYDLFNAVLVELCVSKVNGGKAPGIDNLHVDSLLHAHPIIYTVLARLFYLMLQYNYVPSDFSRGIIVPIQKDSNKLGVLSPKDFRGITLSPVISKIFEHALMFIFGDCLKSCNRQFGFKKGLSCTHAIYTVQKVIDFFVSNDSNVNVCCLDISKAFDCVNHDVLFCKLIDRNVPLHFIMTLKGWYDKLYSSVKWSGVISSEFQILSGLRQGGVLSPILFSVYINDVLVKLNKYGCHINGLSYGSLMYADDLILMSASYCELQCMIYLCYEELGKLGLLLNENKSFLMRFGKGWAKNLCPLRSPKGEIPKVLSGSYLGVDLISGPYLRVNVYRQKRKFYASFNAIYSKLGFFNNEFVSLHIAHTVALPCLLYGTEAFKWNKTQMKELELPWSRGFMKVFKTFDLNVIKQCQFYSGYTTVEDMIHKRRCKFIENIKNNGDILLYNLLDV